MSGTMWTVVAWGTLAGVAGVYGRVWQKADAKKRAWLEWGLAAAVAGLSLASMLTHEPFADELHAWLQAREMTLGALWGEMACEGHFLPWHLILHPFARLGSPVEAMGWISWAINALTVAWFLRKAPLGGGAKAAAMLSCVFLYLNPVISRCYVLVPPILFGLATLWGKRDERPVAFGILVALLANTHLSMEGTVVALFAAFAWQNLLRRKDGKGWKECGRQWTGLGVMAAGGAVAMAQVLPSLWVSRVHPGPAFGWGYSSALLFAPCQATAGIALAIAGFGLLFAEAWKRDRCVCWALAGSLAYMWGFSVFVYPASVIARAALWMPLALFCAWALAGRVGAARGWIGIAVAALGCATMRPEMTWWDWKREYDPLRGVCRWIGERYGKDKEVWINGDDVCAEGAAAYLENVMDWRTGRRAELNSYSVKRSGMSVPFRIGAERFFQSHPKEESFLVLASGLDRNGLTEEDFRRGGLTVEVFRPNVLDSNVTTGSVLFRVARESASERSAFWMRQGRARLGAGDRAGAVAAWKRAVEEDGGQWEAMNKLAWVSLEDGRVAEAGEWIGRTMENAEAMGSAGVWDTAAAVRRAEGDEEGAREAERRRDLLR